MRTDYIVTDYCLVTHDKPYSDSSAVSKQMIKEGWQPWGGPFADNGKMRQAWVKYDYNSRLQTDTSNHY